MSRFTRLGVLLALGWLFFTSPARAVFHLMMVVEVFPGYAAAPNAQFVELQMYFPGQNLVGGHVVQVFNAAGGLMGTFTFTADVASGDNQDSILIATAEAETLFDVTADLVMTPVMSPAGGKVCFDVTPIDCVAWGNYTGSAAGVGAPFSPGGLPLGRSAQRDLGPGGVLDVTDDTDDSFNDFVSAPATPRNNAGNVGPPPAVFSSTPAPPGPISFGSMVVGFPTPGASFVVQEGGDGALTVSNPMLGGTNPGDFSVTTAFPFTIADGGASRTVQLGCTPGGLGARSATLTLSTNDLLRPTVLFNLACTGLPVPAPLSFFTVTPCRVVDTRVVGGPVAAGADRTFAMVGGPCAVPASAKALSLNVAVTEPTAAGNVRLFPAGSLVPVASTINYTAGQTRGNNVVVGLSALGELTARCAPSGATHLILDVNGYFE